MPITKSAKRHVRVSEERRQRNRSVRTQCRSNVVRAGRLIVTGEFEAAREAVAVAIFSLDKAVTKGVIHSNNAARRKARLVKKLNQALAGGQETDA
ncbi:MAG: 30S ribosomal protein S20 [Dehalococcoidales bacterium]|nr:30S ribosomal protein S20 [Dehalococcoidales bacterium]